MSKLTKKNFKIWLITGLSILLTTLLVLSGVGIYFHFSKDKKKQNQTENVVPLLWSIDTWDGKSVSALEFNENYAGRGTTTKTINSAESFIHFINEVNNGKDFADYTIYLNSHIDLNGYTINSIGSEQNKFKGKFDGSYYTIQNVKINGNALFSYTEDATIENLGLYNCTIETGSNIAAGLIAKAVNTNINNTFVRLGKIASAQKVGGLVGEYVSNNGTHSIKNSFVDAELVGSDVGGLISSINTNNSSENEVTIENCYYTNVDKAFSLVDNSTFVNDDTNVVKATSLDEFKTNGFSYDANYDNNKDWTNYAFKAGSRELSFTYPILRQYVKTFLKGSNYESVVVENGKATDASSFAEALEKATSNDVEINVIVEEVFVDEQAEAIDTDVTINVMKDTTIVRSEKNNESMFVATGTSKLVIGSEQTARSVETPKTITLDGNREHVEANNLESGALIVSNGNNVEIHSNVVLKNNINTTTKYGGAVLLYNTDEQATVNATISNCYAENGGGGICVVGTAPKTLSGISYCSTKGNGGGALIIEELEDQQVIQTISKLYGVKNKVRPLGSQEVSSGTTINYSSSGYKNNYSGSLGGALYSYGGFNISGHSLSHQVVFSNNGAKGEGGAIYMIGGSVMKYCTFDNNFSGYYSMYDQSSNLIPGISSAYPGYGGAVYVGGDITMHHIDFSNNKAKDCGGAIFTTGSVTIEAGYNTVDNTQVYSTVFWDNEAQYGAGIYIGESQSYKKDIKMDCAAFGSNGVENTTVEGGAIYIYAANDESLLTLNNVDFDSNKAKNGGAIFSNVKLESNNNVNFTRNSATGNGGAVCVDYTSSFTSTVFDGNTATGNGGAIYLTNASNLTVNTTNFFNNHATTGNGGAVYVNSTSSFTSTNFTSTNFSNNKATGNGGAICLTNVYNLTVNTTNFINNHATTGNGGAIYVSGSSTNINIIGDSAYGSTIGFNEADQGSGGFISTSVDIVSCKINIESYMINNNKAGLYAGAIYCLGDVTTYDCSFNRNTATSVAGAIRANKLTAESTIFESNEATEGGAAWLKNDSTFTNCIFRSNKATSGSGGAIYAINGTKGVLDLNIIASTLDKNSAAQNGGAVYSDGKIEINGGDSLNYTVCTSNHAANGGAIYSSHTLKTHYVVFGSSSNINVANYATQSGGAILYKGIGELSISHTGIYNSYATNGSGGAIYAVNGATNGFDFTIKESYFIGNHSANYGGAIQSDGNIKIDEGVEIVEGSEYTTFKNNYTTGNGGAISSWRTLKCYETQFNANYAAQHGGAIYSSNRIELYSSDFNGNYTTGAERSVGGAVYGNFITAEWCYFEGNKATAGGAIRLTQSSTFTDCTFFNNEATVVSGGAIFAENIDVKLEVVINYTAGFYELTEANFTPNAIKDSTHVSFAYNMAKSTGGAILFDGGLDGSKFEINNAKFAENGYKTVDNVTSYSHTGGAIISHTGQLILNNSVFDANVTYQKGGAVYAINVKTYNCTFDGNKTKSSDGVGGAIYVGGGSCDIDNNTFTSNQAYSAGGAITVIGAITTDISSTTFDQNKSGVGNVQSRPGGAIYGWSDDTSSIGTLKLTNVNFTNNEATSSGGAIYTNGNINYTNTDANYGVITGNIAKDGDGGAICSDNAEYRNAITFNLTGVTNISNNTAGHNGGAIDFAYGNSTNSTINVTAASGGALKPFKNNTVLNYHGGAIHTTEKLTVSGFEFDGNTAGGAGGAIRAPFSDVEVTNCVFTSNTASNGNGGAIDVVDNDIEVTNCVFTSNAASQGNGGAICARNNVKLTNVVFGSSTNNSLGNRASSGGAVFVDNYRDENPTLTIINGGFYNNYARDMGGAIYFAGNVQINDATDTTKHTDFIGNTAGTSGGAIKILYANKTAGVTYDNIANIYRANFDANNVEYSISGGGAINVSTPLTIDNCIFNENISQNKTDGSGLGGGAINGQKITASNCTFTCNQAQTYGGAIYNIDDITVANCTFTSNSTTEIKLGPPNNRSGGAISSKGVVSITGSDFTSNKAKSAGALHVSTDTTVTNTDFDSNETTGGSGGAFMGAIGTITFDNCNFKNNKASGSGGAIYCYYSSKPTSLELHIKGGSFDNNSSLDGGAIYAYGQVYINSTKNGAVLTTLTTFTRNRTTAHNGEGGALFLSGDATNYISNTTFGVKNDATKKNFAKYYGHAILSYANLTLNNCNFYSHDAIETNYGGAICNYGTLNIFGGEFDSNKSINGGAIVSYGTLNINVNSANTQTKFTRNYSGNGGAIRDLGSANICNSIFGDSADSSMANNTNGSGGAIYTKAVNPIIKNCEFYNNISVNGYSGGAISAHGSGEQSNVLTIDGGKFVGNNSHAIFARVPVVVNNGAIFENNTVNAKTDESQSTYGGAIYSTGDVTINGGSFKGNQSYGSASAIWSEGNVTITGTEASPVEFNNNYTKFTTDVDYGPILDKDVKGFLIYSAGKTHLEYVNCLGNRCDLSASYREDRTGLIHSNDDITIIGGTYTNSVDNYGVSEGTIYTKGTVYINVNVDANKNVTKLDSATMFNSSYPRAISINCTDTSKTAYINNTTIKDCFYEGGTAAMFSNINTEIYNSTFINNFNDSPTPQIEIYANAIMDNVKFELSNTSAVDVEGILTLTNSYFTHYEQEYINAIYSDYNSLINTNVLNISNTIFEDLYMYDLSYAEGCADVPTLFTANTINLGTGVITSNNIAEDNEYYAFIHDIYLRENQVVNVVGELSQTYTVYKENVQPYSVENDNKSGLIAYSDPAYNIDWLNDINGKFTVTNIPEGYGLLYNSEFKPDYVIVSQGLEKPQWRDSGDTIYYDGRTKDVSDCLIGFDPTTMDITGHAEFDRGEHFVQVTPKAGYIWNDGTSSPAVYRWEIVMPEGFEDAELYLPSHYTFNGTFLSGISENGLTVLTDKTSYSMFIPDVTSDGGEIDITELRNFDINTISGLTSVYVPSSITIIGANFFNNCNNLQTVIFEEESILIKIGDYAFSNTTITAIDIPETVTSIGDYAFQGCDFTTIKIPHGLTQINSGAFFNCTELVSVEFAENNSLTLIKNESFYGCSKLNTISIPTTVTTIENYAFEYCTALQSVTFGNNNVLTTIGDSVFLGCSSLTEITIPASVTTLGNGVFRACEKLATVTFETDSKLTTISERAFQATALIEITIPKDVVTIGNYAFASCGALTAVTYHVNAELTTVGNNAFNNTSIKYMIFPNKVTSIGDGVFNTAEMLEFVVLPNNDITFGANMFSYTPKLNLIAANATRYAEYTTAGHALSGYESKLTYPVTLTYHYADDMTVVETKLFKRPVGWLKNENNIWLLTDFTLPATEGNSLWLYADGKIVTETNLNDKFVNGNVVDNINIYLTERQPIPIPVFNGDPFLYTGRNYNIADYIDNFDASFMTLSGDYCEYDVGVYTATMTLAEGYKFTDNTTVTTFTWGIGFPEGFDPDQDGDGVDDIVVLYLPEHFTFNRSVLTGLSETGLTLCVNNTTDYIVVMPEVTTAGGTTEIEAIGAYAFEDYINLTKAYISKTVTTIETNPFAGCSGLTCITVQAGNIYYHAKDNCLIETSTNKLVIGCKNSIIPNYVTIIGDYAFSNCVGLNSITIPYGVKTIGHGSFNACKNLTMVEISESVETLGQGAFNGCSNLTTIIFAENSQLKTICEEAFFWSGLTTIEIPASVITIEANVFNKSNLTTVIFAENSQLTTIGYDAFYSCMLQTIEIPANVTELNGNPFRICPYLEIITVEAGNTKYHAKDNCLIETATNTLISGCKNSIIPNYVTIIGEGAFLGCKGLTSIEIPSSVTTIENVAFGICLGLTSIEIPSSVTTFGLGIFAGSLFGGSNDNLVNIIAENADKYAEYTTEGHNLFEYADKITYKVTLTYDYLEEESVVETKLYKRDIKWSKVDGVWTLLESFTLPELDENSCWIYEDGSEVTVENLNAKFTDGTVTNNITIYEKLNAVTINITVNDSTYGDITKNGTETQDSFEFKYVAGTTATPNGNTLTIGEDVYVAIPAESAQYDYIFKGWFEGETQITSAIELTANKNIIAVFEQKLKVFTLTVQSDDSEYGDLVISTGETVDVKTYTVNYGTNLTVNNNVLTVGEETITATPITSDVDGITYVFAGWFAGVEQITENYLVTSTTTIVAKFNKMITVTLNVTGNVTGENGNTYNVIVNDENQVKVGEYTDTFMLLADQTYTFKVSATLIADSANNEYQILNISMGEATKTIASPNAAGLNNHTLTNLMLTEPAEIKFEFLSAYTMKVNMEDVVESKTVTVTSGQLITDSINNLYIIADGSVVSLEVNTVPTGAVEYKFTDITYVLNGETKTVSTNDANGDIKFISMEPPTNGNEYKEKTTGTYKYTISTEKISSITINLKEVVIMEEVIETEMNAVADKIKDAIIENNPDVDPDTILVDPFEISATFTSEHNLTEVLDGESQSLHFYKGTWSVITEMTAIQLDAVLSLTDQGITIVTVDGDYDGLHNADAIVTAIIIP